MKLSDVMDELGTALGTVPGLRAYPYTVDSLAGKVPAAVVLWPESIAYDQTMGRGQDRITLPVLVLVGRVDQRSARDALAGYLDGAGPHSVKAAVEDHETDVWDSARVTRVTPDSVESAGVTYLGATFEIDIFGRGA